MFRKAQGCCRVAASKRLAKCLLRPLQPAQERGSIPPRISPGGGLCPVNNLVSSPTSAPSAGRQGKRVALFATCLVDTMRPTIGFAAAKLLEDAGCIVEVPSQTCCGQPAYNSGDRKTAKALALQMIAEFERFDYVVVPSGSCGGMIIKHYPELFAGDPNLAGRAERLAAKTFELISFLTGVLGITGVSATFDGTVTYHDSCSGLRELGIQSQPRQLLASVQGLRLVEMKDNDVCCGFGGTFAVKYSEISDKIVTEKSNNVEASEAGTLLAGDLGCLLNMAGKLSRQGSKVEVRHIAEVLAGITDTPAIGKAAPAQEVTP
ncbi:MAG: Fe-S oxidoreductase [Rhizobiales bacterium PAR1]|nr:MAG: Fe-S oxidoreductase [Rhizobiales bacterium PAR1]